MENIRFKRFYIAISCVDDFVDAVMPPARLTDGCALIHVQHGWRRDQGRLWVILIFFEAGPNRLIIVQKSRSVL
jgi:hypothetical protein